MDLEKLWAEHKKTVTVTAIVVIVGLLVIKFFDFIFWGSVLVALGVAGVVAWTHLSKKYNGASGMIDAAIKAIWDPQ